MSQDNINTIKNNISDLTDRLLEFKAELELLESLPENNRFDCMKEANDTIHSRLYRRAGQDCEGSYNCGKPQYTQKFYVGKQLYDGILNVEYGRYSKTYYYIDGDGFSVIELTKE